MAQSQGQEHEARKQVLELMQVGTRFPQNGGGFDPIITMTGVVPGPAIVMSGGGTSVVENEIPVATNAFLTSSTSLLTGPGIVIPKRMRLAYVLLSALKSHFAFSKALTGKRVRSIFLACLSFLGNKGPNEESPFEDKWDNGSIYPICEHWLRKIDPPFLSPMRIHSTHQPDHARGGRVC